MACLERDGERLSRDRPVVPRHGACALLGAVGDSPGRPVAPLRSARVLDDERGGLCGRHADRHPHDRVRRHGAAPAWHQPRSAGLAGRRAARLVLLAIVLRATRTDCRAGLHRPVHFALSCAFQLGHIDGLWDPFFSGSGGGRNGSEAVVTSSVSKAFPIADAGFGAVAYVLDVLTGAIGDQRRWRTMPWLVLLFGLLIVPLGAVSVYFIIIQPTVIGALCALCLAQATVTVVLIPYSESVPNVMRFGPIGGRGA